MTATPASLGPVCTYFERADELKKAYPFAANQLRLFGVELAMKMKHADAGRFLMAQMDLLEMEKTQPSCTTPPSVKQAVSVPPPPPPPPPPQLVAADADAPAAVTDDAKPEEKGEVKSVVADGRSAEDAVTSAMADATVNDKPTEGAVPAQSPPPPPPTVEYRMVQDEGEGEGEGQGHSHGQDYGQGEGEGEG